MYLPTKHLSDAVAVISPANKGTFVTPLHVKAENDTVTFTLIGQYTVKHQTSADTPEPFDFYVPFNAFSDVVKGMSNAGELAEITIADDGRLAIKCDSFKTRLSLNNAAEEINKFSEIPEELPNHVTLPMDVITAVKDMFYASSSAEYQVAFGNVVLDPIEDGVRVIATDGFRLAYRELGLPNVLDSKVLLPRLHIPAITKTFADNNVVMTLLNGNKPDAERPTHAAFNNGKTVLICGLSGSTFPDYERVIPADFVNEFTVDADDFSAVVKRMELLSDANTNNRVDIGLDGMMLSLSTNSSNGEAADVLPVQDVTGAACQWAFNSTYLLDSLHQFKGQTVRIKFSGTTSPTLITGDNVGEIAMIVPLRVEK